MPTFTVPTSGLYEIHGTTGWQQNLMLHRGEVIDTDMLDSVRYIASSGSNTIFDTVSDVPSNTGVDDSINGISTNNIWIDEAVDTHSGNMIFVPSGSSTPRGAALTQEMIQRTYDRIMENQNQMSLHALSGLPQHLVGSWILDDADKKPSPLDDITPEMVLSKLETLGE